MLTTAQMFSLQRRARHLCSIRRRRPVAGPSPRTDRELFCAVRAVGAEPCPRHGRGGL